MFVYNNVCTWCAYENINISFASPTGNGTDLPVQYQNTPGLPVILRLTNAQGAVLKEELTLSWGSGSGTFYGLPSGTYQVQAVPFSDWDQFGSTAELECPPGTTTGTSTTETVTLPLPQSVSFAMKGTDPGGDVLSGNINFSENGNWSISGGSITFNTGGRGTWFSLRCNADGYTFDSSGAVGFNLFSDPSTNLTGSGNIPSIAASWVKVAADWQHSSVATCTMTSSASGQGQGSCNGSSCGMCDPSSDPNCCDPTTGVNCP
jgi:hypothetical protein